MGNKKITDLTELTIPSSGDYIPIVDVSDTTDDPAGTTKKIKSYRLGGNTYNVKNYGAVGDGTTDDTSAIQSAINAIVALGGYYAVGIVYFPAGVYKVTSPLTASGDYLSINFVGDGRIPSIIRTNQTTGDVFTIASQYPCSFKHLRIDAAGITRNPSAKGINITGSSGVSNSQSMIEDCEISEQGWSVNIDGSLYTIKDSYINSLTVGIYLTNTQYADAGDGTIYNCTIIGPVSGGLSFGIYHVSGGGLRIINNKMQGFYSAIAKDIQLGNTSILIIEGNSIENYYTNAIELNNATATYTYTYVQIVGNEFGNYAGMYGIRIPVAGYGNLMINDNIFVGNGGNTQVGISMDYVSGGVIADNLFYDTYTGIIIGSNSANVFYGPNGYLTVNTPLTNGSASSGSLRTKDTTF